MRRIRQADTKPEMVVRRLVYALKQLESLLEFLPSEPVDSAGLKASERRRLRWNSEVGICYGFGKHGDSAETRSNTRSPWDTLHPGRKWAGKGNKPNPLSAAKIAALIVAHLKKMAGLS